MTGGENFPLDLDFIPVLCYLFRIIEGLPPRAGARDKTEGMCNTSDPERQRSFDNPLPLGLAIV